MVGHAIIYIDLAAPLIYITSIVYDNVDILFILWDLNFSPGNLAQRNFCAYYVTNYLLFGILPVKKCPKSTHASFISHLDIVNVMVMQLLVHSRLLSTSLYCHFFTHTCVPPARGHGVRCYVKRVARFSYCVLLNSSF